MGALGSTVVITGDVTASEDLTLDGQVTGTIELTEHVLTIGATGRVTARICARIVTIRGSVTGSVTAREKVDFETPVRWTATSSRLASRSLTADTSTARSRTVFG